jgi:hypothetical protein
VEDGGTERASAELVAAGDQQPEAGLALEAVVADLAQLLKGAAPYEDRDVDLSDLEERVSRLVDAEVPGAESVAEMIRLAQQGHTEPTPPGGEPPIR